MFLVQSPFCVVTEWYSGICFIRSLLKTLTFKKKYESQSTRIEINKIEYSLIFNVSLLFLFGAPISVAETWSQSRRNPYISLNTFSYQNTDILPKNWARVFLAHQPSLLISGHWEDSQSGFCGCFRKLCYTQSEIFNQHNFRMIFQQFSQMYDSLFCFIMISFILTPGNHVIVSNLLIQLNEKKKNTQKIFYFLTHISTTRG